MPFVSRVHEIHIIAKYFLCMHVQNYVILVQGATRNGLGRGDICAGKAQVPQKEGVRRAAAAGQEAEKA
jgi:hypothetical protein